MPLEAALEAVDPWRDGASPLEQEVTAGSNETAAAPARREPRQKSEAEIVAQNNAALAALSRQMGGMKFG